MSTSETSLSATRLFYGGFYTRHPFPSLLSASGNRTVKLLHSQFIMEAFPSFSGYSQHQNKPRTTQTEGKRRRVRSSSDVNKAPSAMRCRAPHAHSAAGGTRGFLAPSVFVRCSLLSFLSVVWLRGGTEGPRSILFATFASSDS